MTDESEPESPDVTDEQLPDTDYDAHALGDDIIKTMNRLNRSVEAARDGDEPSPAQQMGMDPIEMMEMFKPQLRQKVLQNPKSTVETAAVLHMATRDILQKHADKEDWETLAKRGLEQ